MGDPPRLDEEALALGLPSEVRRRVGAFFTPAWLVERVLDSAAALVPPHGPLTIVDPACGAGAFLAGARERFPRARLLGFELLSASARQARARLGTKATVEDFDALSHGLEAKLPRSGFELWVGNPPYNGTSPLLSDPAGYRRLLERLPRVEGLPRGTSLRDDYVFFLLRAAQRLHGRAGALAFITPVSLLESYQYASLRKLLLETLSLFEVIELGAGVFSGTRVRACVTVWSSRRAAPAPVRYRRREEGGRRDQPRLRTLPSFVPREPDWLLRPEDPRARFLDERWRQEGEPLGQLVPLSLPGLKTRFDELLVDDSPARLLERIDDFLAAAPGQLARFARRHRLPQSTLGKLAELKRALPRELRRADPAAVRPFLRYAGAAHRGGIPPEAHQYCYLDRRLIPRGDHRLRGAYDPHVCPHKLVFNLRELPLAATVVDLPGCIHDHRHTRFAPLFVPRRLRDEGLAVAQREEAWGPQVPNLSAQGMAVASRRSPQAVFRAIAAFVNSSAVQEHWAPCYGTVRELPIPLAALEAPDRLQT